MDKFQPVTATASKPEAAPRRMHVVARGESATIIARKFLSESRFMTVAEFESALREMNKNFKPGSSIELVGMEAQPVVEKPRPIAKDADIRAIYLTGTMAGSARGMDLVKRWKQLGGNAVVFDIKDSDGILSVPFKHPLSSRRRPSISNLPKYVRWLHQQEMHAIARIALFRDEQIAQRHSRLAIRSRATGEPWLENGKLAWADPSNPEVQSYNLELAKWVADSGADEIQFDYVRFPTEGNQKDAGFAFLKEPGRTRADVINAFLANAYGELHQKNVLVSLDVFGVMAWQRNVDLAHTGQNIPEMAKHCDVLSPMIYPSHFFGMDGHQRPGDAPEHFIRASMERFGKISGGAVLRPWLQAFAWKTRTYSPDYIRKQVATSKQNGGVGFLLWNASNNYAKPFAAMPEMTANADRYFGKLAVTAAAPQKKPVPTRNHPPAVN